MGKLQDADTAMATKLYRELGFHKKITHFWNYYKNIVLLLLFGIALAVLVYVLRPVPGFAPNLRLQFVNVTMPGLTEENNAMEADYETYLGPENTCKMSFSYCEISPSDPMRADVNMEKVMSEVAKWNLELFLFDEYAMNQICPTGFIKNLSTCPADALPEQLWERLIYHKDAAGNEVPMAIDITDTEYVKRMGIQGDSVYIALTQNCDNEEGAIQFVTYILSE